MNKEHLTKEQFAERFMDENSHLCQCHSTLNPPCGFCEGDYINDEYEEYLKILEGEK